MINKMKQIITCFFIKYHSPCSVIVTERFTQMDHRIIAHTTELDVDPVGAGLLGSFYYNAPF